ncbi:MAG: DUF3990 domain-containing protein [Clostridiaceae bacterium]
MSSSHKDILVYHGSNCIVKEPEIRIAKFTKDFYWGFYCTLIQKQAEKWASKNRKSKVVNIYRLSHLESLRYKKFNEMNEEWLEFIVNCRSGVSHDYEVVEGPMADDTIYNYIVDYIEGNISKAAFWELVKFRYPTHQISFHSARALEHLKFEGSYEVK